MLKSTLNKTLYFFVRPFMLTLYVWLGIMFFIPDYFKKYDATIIETKKLTSGEHVFYHDLNGDGVSELLYAGYNTPINNNRKAVARLQHRTVDGKVYDEWILNGKWLLRHKPFLGDFNDNGFAEVYCLTIKNDSILLNVKELMLEGGLHITDKFVTTAGVFKNNMNDVVDVGGILSDTDNDGFKEALFILHGGFSKFPRNLFKYKIANDSITSSPPSASFPSTNIQYKDLNNDGISEITGLVRSPENIHYELPYTDSANWLMVVNPVNMEFLFPPVRLDYGIGSVLQPSFVNLNGELIIAASIRSMSAGKNTNHTPLFLYTNGGNQIKAKNISIDNVGKFNFVSTNNLSDSYFYLIANTGDVYITDTSLNLREFRINNLFPDKNGGTDYHSIKDINGDNLMEALTLGGDDLGNRFLFIYSSDLINVNQVPLDQTTDLFYTHTDIVWMDSTDQPLLKLQTDDFTYLIKYQKNEYYWAKYPAYTFLYFVIYLIFWLIQKAQNNYIKQKYEEEKQLARQRIALSKKSLEPHFMLNILNNIGQMFANEEKENAQYYFGKFASLIHRGLEYADKTETSLYEELNFVKDYLTLQQNRYENLDYIIEADENVDLRKIIIPHSLIYTFAENALKHGLRHKEGEKLLSIKINSENNQNLIIIKDNGIGRLHSKKLKTTGTGKGLGIITNIVESYNKINKRDIRFEVYDLEDGTEVRIWV